MQEQSSCCFWKELDTTLIVMKRMITWSSLRNHQCDQEPGRISKEGWREQVLPVANINAVL
jgi:hypothetical protein